MSFFFDWPRWLVEHFNRKERKHIRQLEAELMGLRLLLTFYADQGNYPSFHLTGQSSPILRDRGEKARQSPWYQEKAVLQDNCHMAASWSVYRDGAGASRPERRPVTPV